MFDYRTRRPMAFIERVSGTKYLFVVCIDPHCVNSRLSAASNKAALNSANFLVGDLMISKINGASTRSPVISNTFESWPFPKQLSS